MSLADDIYYTKMLVPHKDGTVTQHNAGRFAIRNNYLTHLEDNFGLQSQAIPGGEVDDYAEQCVKSPSQHLIAASHKDITNGNRLDFIPEAKLERDLPAPANQAMPKPEAKPAPSDVWHYRRSGHDQAHTLEHNDGHFFLNGNKLSHDETATILDNVRSKRASLRYPKSEAMAKSEITFDLNKSELPDTDPATGLKNMHAYNEFKKQGHPGIYVHVDLNDSGNINDKHGYLQGDHVINNVANLAHSAMGVNKDNIFRNGGDKFSGFFPDIKAASMFASMLRDKMKDMPPVGGTHQPSVSLGMGKDAEHAEEALHEAKKQKLHPETGERLHEPGRTPFLAHGMDGAIPVDTGIPSELLSSPAEQTEQP